MADDHILSSRDGKVGIVTLNRPEKMNALTLEMVHGVRAAASALDADPEVAVILLRAEGERAFCVGGDLFDLLPRVLEAGHDVMNPDPATRFFSDVRAPMVAAVRGLCLGGGVEILLGTDLRIVGESASFGLPEVGIGLIPGSGTNVRLTRQLAWVHAMELLLVGDRIDAARAFEMGLVNRVVPDDQVEQQAWELAHRIARNGPRAMRTAKEIAVRSWALEPQFELEFALNSRVITSEDAVDGIESFRTKTTPRFRNR